MTTSQAPRPKRTAWVLVAVLSLVLIVALGALLSMIRDDRSSPALTAEKTTTAPTTGSTPNAISRSEVMKRYAEINPLDKTATPATIDTIANHICVLLRDGTSADTVITTMNDVYRARATEVAELLVSYQCPGYLAKFK